MRRCKKTVKLSTKTTNNKTTTQTPPKCCNAVGPQLQLRTPETETPVTPSPIRDASQTKTGA